MIESILPASVVSAEMLGDLPQAALFPGEAAAVRHAVDKRQREYATARACARSALAKLAIPPAAIPRRPRGAPQWPTGVVGSITHCAGYRAAAVARIGEVTAVGIDAEPHEPLPAAVRHTIATTEELHGLRRLRGVAPQVFWDRLLFSAKESVYKTWFPLTGQWLDFQDASITVDAAHGTFTARILPPAGMRTVSPVPDLFGRWQLAAGLLMTAITIPAPPQPAMPNPYAWPSSIPRRSRRYTCASSAFPH